MHQRMNDCCRRRTGFLSSALLWSWGSRTFSWISGLQENNSRLRPEISAEVLTLLPNCLPIIIEDKLVLLAFVFFFQENFPFLLLESILYWKAVKKKKKKGWTKLHWEITLKFLQRATTSNWEGSINPHLTSNNNTSIKHNNHTMVLLCYILSFLLKEIHVKTEF